MFGMLFILALCTALGLQYIVNAVIIALTIKGSKGRGFAAIFQGGLCLYLISLLHTVFPTFFFKILVVNVLPIRCFTCIYFLLFTEIADRGSPSSSVALPLSYRFFQSVRLFQDIRGVDARKYVSKQSKSYRTTFFRLQATHCALGLAIPELIWFAIRYSFHGDPQWEHIFRKGTEFLIFKATPGQLLARVMTTMGFWWGASYLLDSLHRFGSIVSVTLGYSRPEDWPKLFGSAKEAYSIQAFWGKVWHHLLRRQLIEVSRMTFDNSKLPTSWYMHRRRRAISLVCIFVISGLLHSPTDMIYWNSLEVRTLPVLRFFVASAAAIMIEKAIGSHYYISSMAQKSPWTKVLGYVWVFIFLCFFSPSFMYPTIRLMEPDKMLLFRMAR